MPNWMNADRPLKAWVAMIQTRLRRDNDECVIITGREGVGKSTLALQLALAVDPFFEAPGMCQTSTDFIQEASRANQHAAVVLDESVLGGFSRDAMATENKKLVRFLQVTRARRLFMIMLAPDRHSMDPYIKNHRARWWFYVSARGEAMLYESRKSPHMTEPFWVRRRRIRFGPASGPVWGAYYAQKLRFARSYLGDKAVGQTASDVEALTMEYRQDPDFVALAQRIKSWRPVIRGRPSRQERARWGPHLERP